jgi:hypothetical protein
MRREATWRHVDLFVHVLHTIIRCSSDYSPVLVLTIP